MSGSTISEIVIVPDGLAAAGGKALAQPSFAYRAVLDAALQRPPQDILMLAPANRFGGTITEEEAAEVYLRARGRTGVILRPPPVAGGAYVDTSGNARHLRIWLQQLQAWPLTRSRLLVAARHAPRALLCFRKEGFQFEGVDRVSYAIPPREEIVTRLCYYRWPLVHRLYEAAALIRDGLRPAAKAR